MKLPLPLATAMEASLNRYLALDPQATTRVLQLRGNVVQLQVTGLEISVFFLFQHERVEILENFDGPADAVIRGAPLSLVAVARGTRSIHDGDVELAGDAGVAQKFSRLFANIDIDWEEHLSKLAGDSIAHQFGRLSRSGGAWMTRTRIAMRNNVADYLRDETDHLPHDWEMDEYSDSVDDLRDRIDRLEARIRLIDSRSGTR